MVLIFGSANLAARFPFREIRLKHKRQRMQLNISSQYFVKNFLTLTKKSGVRDNAISRLVHFFNELSDLIQYPAFSLA